jgi:hypothetical protein
LELDDWRRAISSGSRPSCSLEEALRITRVLDAVQTSARLGEPVSLQ